MDNRARQNGLQSQNFYATDGIRFYVGCKILENLLLLFFLILSSNFE